MSLLSKIIDKYSEYEKSYELDRLWNTFLIPDEKLSEFVFDFGVFLKTREKGKASLTISWNRYFEKFECTVTNYK